MNFIDDLLSVADLRYERKALVTDLSRYEIESLVKMHPALFREKYPPRHVNSIYFDTPDLLHYFANLSGISHRMKVRIRWYGKLLGEIPKPVLEIKVKRGYLGGKIQYPLQPFVLDMHYSKEKQQNIFDNSGIKGDLKEYLKTLQWSILCRYYRRYFESTDGAFRITLDTDLEFYRMNRRNNTFSVKVVDRIDNVIEVKYSSEHDERADMVTQLFPFRITKNSKYASAIEKTYFI